MDKAARLIFPVLAALIIVATIAYLFGASRVEINPGKEAGYTTAHDQRQPTRVSSRRPRRAVAWRRRPSRRALVNQNVKMPLIRAGQSVGRLPDLSFSRRC